MKQENFKQKRHRLASFSVFMMLIAVFGISFTMQAQVTIGALEEPVKGALLQLKEMDIDRVDGSNADKGFALPRVALSEKDKLYPMCLNDPDYDENVNPVYWGKLNKSHIGLIVYNVTEDEEEDLFPGLYRWNGEEWVASDSKMGSAQFYDVDCSSITVNGMYIENTPVTSANYLTITLNVKKAGAFVIMATTGKGYGFYLSGVALNAGEILTVNVPCQGVPSDEDIGPPSYKRTDELSFNGINVTCVKTVEVVSAVSEYSINCSSIAVNGQYLKGEALTTQTITLYATVSNAGSYSVFTPLTNGIRFAASGNFPNAGTYSITLLGTGTPTVNEDFPITINTNSPEGNVTCNTTIPITLPAMTFAVIGDGTTWTWNAPSRYNALTNGGISFGPNTSSIVKIVSLTRLWQENDPTTAAARLNNTSAQQPDILLYFAYPNAPTPASGIIPALVNYINNGGCVIYGYASGNSILYENDLLDGVFGAGVVQAQLQTAGIGTTDDNTYPIADLPDDPIINGPFGKTAGRYWGEDNASNGSAVVTSLPPNSVQICSAANLFGKYMVDPEYSIVWYNDSKNFVYFGDCTGADYSTNTSMDGYPSIFNASGLPQTKRYGNYPNQATQAQFVYNSVLELNAIAWALKKAANSGINPH